MKILAFYSIKGGVGKTASCVNLAYLAAAEGRPTLLCDLDPQASASYYFRIKAGAKFDGRKFLRGGKRIDKNIRGTDFANLDLLPADFSFRDLDLLLNDLKRSRKRLRELLQPLAEQYAFIFLDCPLNITLVAENIFRAADFIFVPMIPTVLSVRTFAKLVVFFKQTGYDRRRLWPFFSMVEKRKSMHRQFLADARLKKWRVLQTAVPYLSEIERMGFYREPLTHHRPGSPAVETYRALWQEMKRLMEGNL